MQLLGVARLGPRLVAHARDRVGIESAQLACALGQAAAKRHGARPALLERRVVEVGVGPPVQDLVRERRGLGRVDEVRPHRARLDGLEQRDEPVDVGGLVQAVVHGLADHRVLGDLDGPRGGVFLAGGERGKRRGHQVVGLHALDRGRIPAPAALAQDHERATEVPPPAHLEHRREQERLRQRLRRGPRRQEARDFIERQALAGTERQHDRVVARRRLQLEVEAPAEALAERQAERAVDASAERRVDHELHPARLVEEALEDEMVPGRQDAEGELGGAEVADDLRGGDAVEAALGLEPLHRARAVVPDQELPDARAQLGHLGGQLGRARGRLAEPEGHRGRRALGVDDAHDAGLDAPDAPRGAAEEERVAGHALDGPVLVHGADDGVVGIGDYLVVGRLRDGAARGDGGDAGPAASAQDAIHPIVVQPRAARTAPRLNAVREHLEHGVEVGAGQVGIGRGATDERVEVIFSPRLADGGGHDLLGQDVERRHRRQHAVEPAGAHAAQERRALHQLVARGRVEAALGRGAARMARAADALQERREAPRRADLADELDGADVDAQLERRRRDEDLEVPRAESSFELEPAVLREAPVMGGRPVLTDALGQQMGEPLRQAPRVHEDERGAVLGDVPGDLVEDLSPLLVRGDRLERALGQLDGEIERPPMAEIDDAAHRRPVRADPPLPRSDEEPGNGLDGALRCREADALRWCARRARPALPESAPDARRACHGPRRGSRRRSPRGPAAGARGSSPPSP